MSDETPLPLEQVSGAEAADEIRRLERAVQDPHNPMNPAVRFVNAVRTLGTENDAWAQEILEDACLDGSVWGDFSAVRELMGDRGIGTVVRYSPERPDDLAYVKMIDTGGQLVRAFDAATLPDALVITVVRPGPGLPWRVYAITPEGEELPASAVFSD